MKRRVLSACGALLAAAALGSAAAPAASAGEACPAGHVCAYNDIFSGGMRALGAEYDNRFLLFERLKTTIYNRYANRLVWSGSFNGWTCLNPGMSLTSGSLMIYVGTSGSRC